ncbi:galactose mutarotase-like domain-containing protein [Mrakia frigida]|uniref:galactose mutarotase-like domain-containing protein n=1 Tax=Mrakia frigida TaxID=29902 RepID=UPI003FCC1641
MTISDDGNILTLEFQGASTQIYFYGAHVTSWKAAGSQTNGGELAAVERFFMSSKAVLDGSAPIRGGIPIAFPIFATDVHPDYPDLGGAHGFARIHRWTLTHKVETEESVGVTLTLEPNEQIQTLFPPSFKLDLIVTLTKHTLDTELKIANPGTESFRFNTALHTFPLGSLPFTNRLNPSSPADLLSEDSCSLGKETARCYHLPDVRSRPNTVRFSYDRTQQRSGPGIEIQLSGGWKDAVFWNPGRETGDKIGDLGKGEWERFGCWEPGCIERLEMLEAGGEWRGRQVCRAV